MNSRRPLWAAAALFGAIGVTVFVPARAADHSYTGLIDAVLREGPEAELPPHLSMVLGLTRIEHSVPVKQAVIHDGHNFHVFNVGTANHKNLVILTHDDQDQSTKAYLISRAGQLRKAVAFHDNEVPHERSAAEARDDFAAETQFWTNFSSRLPAKK